DPPQFTTPNCDTAPVRLGGFDPRLGFGNENRLGVQARWLGLICRGTVVAKPAQCGSDIFVLGLVGAPFTNEAPLRLGWRQCRRIGGDHVVAKTGPFVGGPVRVGWFGEAGTGRNSFLG